MKLTKLKKIISGTVSALMIASSIPFVASAADQRTTGNIGGYDYEMWNQDYKGTVSMNPGAGNFTCSWSGIENFLARMGKNFDSQKKNYKDFGNITLTYDVEYTPRGNSYMCVYGWTRNPLVEYYIVEGWGDWRPPGNEGERKGSVTINGNTYDIAKTTRYNQPSIDGSQTFPQYWSIRQTSGSANNQTNYMKGTVDVSKHFDAWAEKGLDMSGSLYEVSLNIEGFRSNGSANVKSITVTTGGSSTTNELPQQNNGWNNWNNQQPQQNNDWNSWNNQQPQQNNDWNNWNNQQPANTQDKGTAMDSSATMSDDFRNGSSKHFIASDGWTNGDPFDCGWYKAQTGFQNGALTLSIDKDYSGKYNYAGAEYRSNDFYHYGYYETSMQAIKNKGVVSSFFTYTGESDGNPWDEIDIEILGKNTNQVQFNYYTNGQGKHEKLYDLGFDSSEAYHTYGFDWQPDHITWYVDGKPVYTATENIPKTAGKIMMNAWPGKDVDDWLDRYDGKTPLTARYQWVTYKNSGNSNNNNQQPQQNNDWNNQWNNQQPQQNNDWNNQWNNQQPQQNNDWNNQWNNQQPQQNNDWNNQWNNQQPQQNNDWNNQWNNQQPQQNNDWNNQWNNQQPQQNNDWNNQWNNQQPQQNNDWNNQWNNQQPQQNNDWNNQWNNQQPQQNNDWNNWNFDWTNNVTKWGDANNDKSVDMGDTVSIMQSLANPNNHQLSEQGMWNADVYQPGGGITNSDAASLQSYLLGFIPNLPDQNNWNQSDAWNNWNNQQQNNNWNNNNQQPQQNNDWNNQWNNQQNNNWNNQQNNNSAPISGGQTFSVGNGQNRFANDNVDGYSYEIWLDNTGGSGSMTLGSGGTFSTEWSAQVNAGNFLARRGRNYDASKKATQYGPIVMDYAADYSASSQGNSRLCVYGWMKDPLVEYYIIEDWVNWCPSAQGGSKTVTIDGAEYEIFQLDHTGPTILGDTRTFKQYFSVRKSKRTSGTITVSDHFKAWADAGWNIGNLTEVALNVEGWESSGKANVTKLTISEGSGGNNNSQPQQNNQWNNQQQNNGWNNNAQPANNGQSNSGKKLVAISFDDGASATSRQSPAYRIMDALIKNNMSATFFYVGDWIRSNEQVQFAYQNGMEVANHTKSHQSLGSLGSQQIRSEWEQCNSKLRSIIGAEPSHLMRLPYLDGGGQVKSALYDIPLISCGIDTKDWDNASKDQIVNTIKQAAQNGSLEGKIVLCHENYETTAAAMEEVLPWLAQNGYANVTISEMFAAKGKTLQGGQIYTQA
ncbi:glycoside hydrolase family 11 protein [Ruminococcus sp.]|uniref:beta-glucanase n=1 Tax=Ruminococcus sp. TaxID=41978 RepID=UPI0026007AA4|nr:glycoside hydrolase family 11 protein [Ruminococcus sp.]